MAYLRLSCVYVIDTGGAVARVGGQAVEDCCEFVPTRLCGVSSTGIHVRKIAPPLVSQVSKRLQVIFAGHCGSLSSVLVAVASLATAVLSSPSESSSATVTAAQVDAALLSALHDSVRL